MTGRAQVTVRKKGNRVAVVNDAKARAADLFDGKPDLDGKADNS